MPLSSRSVSIRLAASMAVIVAFIFRTLAFATDCACGDAAIATHTSAASSTVFVPVMVMPPCAVTAVDAGPTHGSKCRSEDPRYARHILEGARRAVATTPRHDAGCARHRDGAVGPRGRAPPRGAMARSW